MQWAKVASISPPRPELTPGLAGAAAHLPAESAAEGCARSQTPRRQISWRLAWLTFRVHADAFRLNPFGYAQALIWRLRRLRVRSRNRVAALAGRSPHAYALCMERERLLARAEPSPGELGCGPKISAVIDCRRGSEGLESTLSSLLDAGALAPPIVIGAPGNAGTMTIECPRDLARLITGSAAWLLPLRPGDRLAVNSLAIYAEAAAQAHGSWLVYADDDLIGARGVRQTPHFKPDWNPELFEHHDFVTGASIVRADRDTLENLPDDGWADALVHRALDHGSAPVHVKRMLHHRQRRPQPTIPAKPSGHMPGAAPSVTAIIPTRNRHELLRNCIEGLRRTAYPVGDTIVVDNGSDEPATLDYLSTLERDGVTVLRVPGPFNYSALNNAAVRRAQGELLCFLNNDVEMPDPDWLALLVRHAVKPDIGAVGARLLYPDGTVQHAGVFTGIGGGAGHGHRFQRADEPGYFERARLPQRVSAVTGASMVVAREKFLAVGGFDAELFPVAFNDVDLCLKLNSRQWQSFYEPRATLTHHESKSRGSDRSRANRARFAGELAALKQRWNTDRFRDPYHHPNLSPFCEQFLIAV